MKPFIIFSILLISPLLAQEQQKPNAVATKRAAPPLVQKLFILKYADPAQIRPLLSVFGAQVTPNSDLHALAVAAEPTVMPAIEDAIKRLDVPAAAPQNIELTVYYLIGGESENTPGGAIPRELESVVAQLKNSFAFKIYRLMDTLTLRTRTGQSADTSSSPGPAGPGLPAATDQFHIRSATVTADGSTISLTNLKAGTHLPVARGSALRPEAGGAQTVLPQFTYADLGLNADVDIKKDQKVVVGRLSINKDQALFLVLTARVVN